MPTSKYKGSEIDSLLDAAQTKIGEAPKDSTSYARQNNAWVRLNQSLLATVVGPRQMIAQNGSGEQAYTFSFDRPAASITLKSLSISGPGVSLKAGYSKSGFTVVATNIVGDITAIVTATFTFGSIDYTIDAPIIVSYQRVFNANGYDYVDLGLPSGTLWATCNVGATTISDKGKFFMWGELEGNTVSGSTPGGGRQYTQAAYNALGLNAITSDLDLAHDAAHYHMGGDWHIPTNEQIQELCDYTTTTVGFVDNTSGRIWINKNDDSKWIFIPYTGYCYNSECSSVNEAFCWSSSIYVSTANYAYCLRFKPSTTALPGQRFGRSAGLVIRAVI